MSFEAKFATNINIYLIQVFIHTLDLKFQKKVSVFLDLNLTYNFVLDLDSFLLWADSFYYWDAIQHGI